MKALLLLLPVALLPGCASLPALHAAAAAAAAQAGTVPVVAAAAAAAGVGIGVGVLASDDIKKFIRDAEAADEKSTPGTFGAFLHDNRAKVNGLVEAGMKAQRESLVAAASKAKRAIENARIAFRDKLSLDLARLGDDEKTFKAELEALVADLESESELKQKFAGDRAQQMAYRFRYPPDAPYVATPGPIWLFPFLPNQVVTVSGRFPASGSGVELPLLKVNEKVYKPFNYSADSVSFSIPAADLDASDPRTILWKRADLLVPATGRFSAAGDVIRVQLDLAVLPNAFGRMTVDSGGRAESFDLAWGSKHYFKDAPGGWRLRYFRTGGGVKEVESSDQSSPLIRIQADTSGVQVSVYPF